MNRCKYNEMGNFKATVDGKEVTGSMYSATKQTGVVLFEISGLEQGTHTLTFESIRDDAGRAKTSFDYLKVLEGETIDWNPTVESQKVKFEGSWAR